MKKALLVSSLAIVMATPAVAAPWVRSYVLSNYEPAFYFGGRGVSTQEAGTDCPKGTIPELDYRKVIKTPWRTDAEIEKFVPTSGTGDNGANTYSLVAPALAHRSFRKDISTYINPFTAPDPGMQEVTGKISLGFNLDANAKTGGFTSPDGERGIDNAFYRAIGCTMSFRGTDWHAYLNARSIDKMLDGMYTIVIRVSGNEDPMNDKHAVVEIGYTPDHIVKDPAANVTSDYSFRIVKSAQYTKLNATIKNGVVDTDQVADLHMPDYAWYETNRGDVDYQKGKIRLYLSKDGAIKGVVGGYRDWRNYLEQTSFNAAAPGGTGIYEGGVETYYHHNWVGIYYSLQRNADGMPDAKGHMMAISSAMRFDAVPAFVVDGAIPAQIEEPLPIGTTGVIPAQRAAFRQATLTYNILPDPSSKFRKKGVTEYGTDGPDAAPVAPKSANQQVNNLPTGKVTTQ